MPDDAEPFAMLRDPELSALLDQAARNLDTLELLVRSSMAHGSDALRIHQLRERLRDLRLAYTRETDALTQKALQRAIERRVSGDRRRNEDRDEETSPAT